MKELPAITVVRRGRRAVVQIDGEDFPWPIAANGVEVPVVSDECPTITLTILAESVSVDNRFGDD